MKKNIQAFAQALRQEFNLYQTMMDLSLSKRMAISQNDLKAITDVTAQENEILQKIAPVAKVRADKALELAAHYGLPLSDMTLRQLIACMPAEVAGPLEELRAKFSNLLTQLSQNTEVIADVLQARMLSTQAAINTLSQAEPLGNNYTRYGQTTAGAQSRLRMMETDI